MARMEREAIFLLITGFYGDDGVELPPFVCSAV